MDDDRVVTVEKKATNKIGLFFLIIIVIGALGFGAFYYLTNKNLIVFEYKLPWQKDNKEEEEDEKENNQVVDNTGKKSKEELPLTREKVEIDLNKNFFSKARIFLSVTNNDFRDDSYYIRIQMFNGNVAPDGGLAILKVKAIRVDGYLINQAFTMQANPGETSSYELVIPDQDLNKYRISSFSSLSLISDLTVNGETNEETPTLKTNSEAKSDIKTIAKLFNVNKEVRIDYYKKVESSSNTKVYFFISNNSPVNYTYNISKLIVNNKEINTTTYKETVYAWGKYISIVDIPKDLFSQNKTIKVSFILMKDNKSVYRTVDKDVNI